MNASDLGRGAFRAAFDHAPVGMAMVTRGGHRIVRVNRVLADLLGVEPTVMVGRSVNDYRERRAGRKIDSWRGADEVPGFTGERPCRRADGSTVWLEVHTSVLPDRDDGGEPLCLLHLVDVRDRKSVV